MNKSKLTILAIITAVMVIAAVAVNRITNRPALTPQTRGYLIQGLDPAVVSQILIKGSDTAVTLTNKGGTFVIAEKDDHPATNSAINELLTQVLDIKTTELQTSDSRNHADLEVTQDNARNIVQFLDSDANTITGVIIGKNAESGDSYARIISSDEVYLCRNVPWIRSAPLGYLDQSLIDAKHDDIISVTVTDANGITYTLESEPNSSDIALATSLPQGKKLKANYKSVFSALTSLRFDDVMKQDSAPAGLTFKRTYICKLKDSTSYILKLSKTGDKTYATVSATFADKKEITIDTRKRESEEELKRKEAKLLARKAADELNAKCKGWVYEIPSYKANNLTKSLSGITEDIESEKEEKEASEE